MTHLCPVCRESFTGKPHQVCCSRRCGGLRHRGKHRTEAQIAHLRRIHQKRVTLEQARHEARLKPTPAQIAQLKRDYAAELRKG